MSIELVPEKEIGEKYPAVIWGTELTEGDYGPQLLVKLIETNGNYVRMYLPVPATPRNRTGRVIKSLTGDYDSGKPFDETVFVGMAVDLVYAVNRQDNSKVSLDLLKPRKGTKEDTELVTTTIAKEELEEAF